MIKSLLGYHPITIALHPWLSASHTHGVYHIVRKTIANTHTHNKPAPATIILKQHACIQTMRISFSFQFRLLRLFFEFRVNFQHHKRNANNNHRMAQIFFYSFVGVCEQITDNTTESRLKVSLERVRARALMQHENILSSKRINRWKLWHLQLLNVSSFCV